MQEKLKLNPGDTLRFDSSRSTGFMGETDISNYSVLDASGNVVGSVEHTEHMAVKGFRVSNTVVQRSKDGTVLLQQSW